MFEGLVRQLIVGYLGRYIKDIQREQLKITLWNEEVLLENVDLTLDAFDYLQLPFALKQGRVGRLSIKIPWKKLGWDPIIIILEDVFVCACQRDEQEWSTDAVEKREFAGKKAKLAAAELAKLSRRVCDNQAGQSFISYITAKILDGIQVSMRNVHALYRDMLTHSGHTVFGLKFSSLTIMKQNLVGFSSIKVRGSQVNKLVEIQGLEIYCSTFHGNLDFSNDTVGDSKFWDNARFEGDEYIYILAPFDLSASLLVNRSGKLENDAPQYSINGEITGLIMSLDEVQLQRILTLWDYLCTCRLREKYGRYRPWNNPLSRKLKGWQRAWWFYAQQSVLSDVRKRLKKTSWKYLAERINSRRKYVNLYKTKLECLRQEQLIDEDILWELEQMEKESDIDDILSYRSTAERELKEFLANSDSCLGIKGANVVIEKSQDDDRSSSKPRGWLNWLSRGVLGAGGTDDSSQFSGVVSDEVIKDIYEATKFQPVPSPNGVAAADDEIYFSSIKFNIQRVSATLRSMKFHRAIAELIFNGMFIECKLWEESAVVTATVNAIKMINPSNEQILLFAGRDTIVEDVVEIEQAALSIQVHLSQVNRKVELSVKVMLQPLEVTCNSELLLNIMEFYNVLRSFKFQHERVLWSLNGIEDVKTRLLSKAEYILSSRKAVIWDVNFVNIIVTIPWENSNSELHKMILESGALSFASKRELGSFPSDVEDQSHVLKNFVNHSSTSDICTGLQHDLYDHFEMKINDFGMKIMMPHCHQTISVLEKFCAYTTFASCIIPNESILKQLGVYIIASSLLAHFSPSIYGAVLGLKANFDMLDSKLDSEIMSTVDSLNIMSIVPNTAEDFSISVFANLELIRFRVNLENDIENSCIVMLALQELDIRYVLGKFPECWISLKDLRISTFSSKCEIDSHILCSSGNQFAARSQAHQHDMGVSNPSENCCDKSASDGGCFLLHYKACRNSDIICHKYAMCLSNIDIHCYPHIIGLLVGFSEKISEYGLSRVPENSFSPFIDDKNSIPVPGFCFKRFGFSNFYETGYSEWASIPLDHFPFVTIYNFGSLCNLKNSLIYDIPGWRKIFNLREREIRSPSFCVKEGSNMLNAPPLKSTFGSDASPLSQSFGDIDPLVVDSNLSGVRVHFHDSSCIVGTITLPTSRFSLAANKDCFDILCSTDGLILSSLWCTKNIHDFLWGPSLPSLSPILNMRIRKGNAGSLKSELEISFSTQHVTCVLPPEFLAIIIGYFSLPDWSYNAIEKSVTGTPRYKDSGNSSSITYKFEILDCILLTPVETDNHQFLKLEIPQFYCSFLHNSDTNLLKDITPECLVRADKIADRNHCLNLFGRDLSLYLLLLKDDAFNPLIMNQSTGQGDITLISPLSADIWVRIPQESESSCVSSLSRTCIMASVDNCQIIVEDGYVIAGFEALVDVINQFSSVHGESKGFTSDVLQFLQLKRSMKEIGTLLPEDSTVTYTETSFCFNSLSINLYRSRRESLSSELVAKANMQLTCSASWRNEIPLRLDISFSSLALFSPLHSVILARCSSFSVSPVLDMHLSMSDQGENELHVSLPNLDIWLRLFEWSEVVALFNSYTSQLAKTSIVDASSKNSNLTVDRIENVEVHGSQNTKRDGTFLIVKSDNIDVTIHIPVCVSLEAFSVSGELDIPEGSPSEDICDIVEGKCDNFIAITLQSRHCELVINGRTARLKSNLEKTNGIVKICQDNSVHSWPFFQLFEVNVVAEICSNEMEQVHVKAEVQCHCLDVWLSYNVLYFWQHIPFRFPEAGSSQFAFSCFNFKIQLGKVSLLLTDARWSSNGPLLEILMRNLLLDTNMNDKKMECSVSGDLQVNYNNINKVLWEPFVEPWKFQLNVTRKYEKSALLNSAIMTDFCLFSTAQLNLNVTESLVEVVFRAIEMIEDAWGPVGVNRDGNQSFLNYQNREDLCTGRYAPYVLQNLTSLPLVFHVFKGPVYVDDMKASSLNDGKLLQPGSCIPIYVNETPEEQLFHCCPSHSSDRLNDKQPNGVVHHYIMIQLDGTSVPSAPISMDLVGVSYFEVDFSKSSNNIGVDSIRDALKNNKNVEENNQIDANSGFVVPVVFDVSVQRYSKLVRLYSSVILFNATSIPLEVRFDIPFGVSPKILDPIYPCQEFPLPLHLAEAGRMRWRPLGHTYLWSEAHNISNILSHESRIGFLRSFVCYPSHPSSDPFRCCISVQDICLPSTGKPSKGSSRHINSTVKQSFEDSGQLLHNVDKSNKRFIHQVTLSSPLVVKNYLPEALSLTIESGGVKHTTLLSEVETSYFHIDSSHELGLAFHMNGFKPSILKFPRAESFSTTAKFSGTKFSLSEIVNFDPASSHGPIYVTLEKIMDAFSGAREICIFVPFLLYNCIGFPLVVSDSTNEMKGYDCTIPSYYDLDEQDLNLGRQDGLGLLSSNQDLHVTALDYDRLSNSASKNHIVSTRKKVDSNSGKLLSKPLVRENSTTIILERSDEHDLHARRASLKSSRNGLSSSSQSNLDFSDFIGIGHEKVKSCMYSPKPNSSAGEFMVKVSQQLPECYTESTSKCSWSSPFLLVPPTGSTSVLVPQPYTNAAYIVSVTASAIAGPFSGRTRAITFQPRYVIGNACSKYLCFKQKGTNFVSHLGIGHHYHLHWKDTTRELLVSVRFNEPGWQWSGCFSPEHLGDTQVKMRNYVSGAVNMIRVEVQNADVAFKNEKIVGNPDGNSGTNLILLSDDDTGFMPYRIDNFSKERLRIYQQRCETFETLIHSYTSCPYAWDEPCYPHRLTVEVPGERILGSYSLDEVKECATVCLPSTSEKPERTLLVSVRAEGALKVLSIIDSSHHILIDMKDPRDPQIKENRKHDQKQETFVDYNEKISIAVPFIGISLMNSYSQELLFACARNTSIDLLQSLDQQKFALQISSLQIDNQLQSTPYPVILSFDHENRSNLVGQMKNKDENTKIKTETVMQVAAGGPCETVFCFSAAKWRNENLSLVSFEYISLRVADFHLELEQEVILSLFDFLRTVSSRFKSRVLTCMDSTTYPLVSDVGFTKKYSSQVEAHEYVKANWDQHYLMNDSMFIEKCKSSYLPPSIVPIGAPWQKIYLLARRQKKIYLEVFDLAPIKLTLSFSSNPWILRNGALTSGESLIHRGLMALADVEGAQIYLNQLTIAHHMASWESIQEILVRHYTRQLLHEMYKVFGSAGVIGNPMGFARSVGLGIKDFLSVPARSILQSPAGIVTGMAQGTTSLLSNTVYALSDAATQFSKAAHKGIVAFTFDDQAVAKMEQQKKVLSSHSKGVVNEFFEGLTGLLQSPIKGAEKHGLPGVLSGIALGLTGLVARPAASILEVTGKTAQSIKNRSKLHQMATQRYRVRLPRPLSRVHPLKPYSWEEAVGTSVLVEADDGLKLEDEALVMCKTLKQGGRFVIITERLILIVSCSCLVDLGKPEFRGVPADPEWMIEAEIGLDSVIHADNAEGAVHIVGSNSDTLLRQNQQHLKRGGGTKGKRWNNSPTPLPLFQTTLEFTCKEEAEEFLQVLKSTIEKGKEQGWGSVHLLHQSSLI
ncbi:uncharacterized protein LOC132312914 [Cornus florida]|uniref:uncharacterized protein LOC132312914 n=1 Tax=Cornus florida TaxID=4283 RepID=UPI00289BEC92|nr:uncharacterized protein LOC132312914 [Cornus florida]